MAMFPGTGRPWKVCVLIRWRAKVLLDSFLVFFISVESSSPHQRRFFSSGDVFRAPVTVFLLGFQRAKETARLTRRGGESGSDR